ncbi:flagellar motor switch protein FliM [Frigidibacter oleivorans]|uniref:flagellar motor switch protein FliM n=1 Tax=Frigidibacter oleivorans TaxID=2487129 RepID=UPI001F46B85A|nr:flagellar motor switch protein FliM [Frigidibacter oleivorans]
MRSPKKLSSSEVAALVGGLLGDAPESQAAAEDARVRPYSFGVDDLSNFGDFHGLRMINERYCRTARAAFQSMLRFHPRISSFPPELRSFDDYRDTQDNFLSLSVSQIEELRGTMLMVLPASFVSILTNAYFGGGLAPPGPLRGEFTVTEHKVIELIGERLTAALELAWRDMTEIRLTATTREENMQFATFADGDEMVVVNSFIVQLPGQEPEGFDILYPVQTLKPVAALLRSRVQSDRLGEDRSWREQLEQALLSVPLDVSARLCAPELPLSRLMSLADGEVIPVSLPERADVMLDGRALFEAQPGEQSGQAAIAIIRRLTA